MKKSACFLPQRPFLNACGEIAHKNTQLKSAKNWVRLPLVLMLLTACEPSGNITQTVSNMIKPEIRNEITVITERQPQSTEDATRPVLNQKPVIQQIQVNPTQTAGPNDILTLQALVHDPENDLLQLRWSASKGTISATQGIIVTWNPRQSDGQLAQGSATISLLVADGQGNTDTASVTILIDQQGASQVTS